MTTAPITEAEIKAILSEQMSIEDSVEWWPKSDQVFVEMTLKVKQPQRDASLVLKMTVNRLAGKKFSISLLLNGSHRVVGLDINGSHSNSHTDANSWRGQTHEHRWTDACHGAWAQATPDLPGTWQGAFNAFCERNGITFVGEWSDPLPLQLGFGDK